MAFKLNIGQYYRAVSPIHRMDARVKICCALACVIALFSSANAAQLALSILFVAAIVKAAKIPLRQILDSIRPLVGFMGFLSLFNLLFVQSGEVLLALGILRITTGGVWAAVLYTVRFGLAFIVGGLILLTTTPTQLADAFDSLLAPLARLGLPAHEIAMVLSLVLRFIPTLANETAAVIDAQAMRGGGLDEGGLAQRARSTVAVLIAVLTGGLRHAEGLSRALDARCYEGGARRTHLHVLRVTAADIKIALLCAGFVAAHILLR